MRHVQIRLEDSEFEDFEKAWKARGYGSQQAAGKDALLEWCGKVMSPFGEMTIDQRETLAGVLRIIKEETTAGKAHALAIEILVGLHPKP